MKTVSINPITRLEGHGRIDLFINDEGDLENAYLIIPELRGFEKFCQGRPVEEMPRITTRICGVCPEAHHIASAKACDAVYHVTPPPTGRKLRELLYNTFFVADHSVHFYALGGPDFVVGPDAPPGERNILGVVRKAGIDAGKKFIELRARAQKIIEFLGGKKIHQVTSIPGGVTVGLTEEFREKCVDHAKYFVEFAKFTLKIFNDIVLANKDYVDLILSDTYNVKPYSMGLVDENNQVNFYDGKVRVVDQEGNEVYKFDANRYSEIIEEHIEPWSYLKFPFLKEIGWNGLRDGKDSGIYMATPLSRLNVSDGLATTLANEEYEKMYKTLGGKPVHATLATHWARVIEIMYAAEKVNELLNDPDITGDNYRTIPTETPTEGVGVVEAPRGILFHHYVTDENGILQKANLIVGTTHNHAAISLSIKKAAQGLIGKGKELTDGILNMIEMAFRAYDPCFGCATHSITGKTPLKVNIYDKDKNLLKTLKQ